MKLAEFRKRLSSLPDEYLGRFDTTIKTESDWNELKSSLVKAHGMTVNKLPAMKVYNAALAQSEGDRVSDDAASKDEKTTTQATKAKKTKEE